MNNLLLFIIAQAEHTATHAAAEEPSFFDLLVHSDIFNVTIVAAILIFFVYKYKLLSGLTTEQERIMNDIRNAETSKEESIKKLHEAEARLNNAKQEADNIISEAEKVAAIMRQDIIEKANLDAEKIIDQAKKAVENEKQQAAIEMQNNLTRAAIEVAGDSIKNTLNDDWQRKLIQDFVNDLDKVKAK